MMLSPAFEVGEAEAGVLAGDAGPAGQARGEARDDDQCGARGEAAGHPVPAADLAGQQVVGIAAGFFGAGRGYLAGGGEADQSAADEIDDPQVRRAARLDAKPADRPLDGR